MSNMAVAYVNGRLICSFEREIKNKSISDRFFDLNEPYYLLVAKGPLDDDSKIIFITYYVYILAIRNFKNI